jgi:hypothetical protein
MTSVKIFVEIAEEATGFLPPPERLSRERLEAYLVDRYRKGTLTQRQVGIAPGLDRWSTEELLRHLDVLLGLALEEFEAERASRRRVP